MKASLAKLINNIWQTQLLAIVNYIVCLLHGIEFQIVLQNLYLARLKTLDLCCWVCVFLLVEIHLHPYLPCVQMHLDMIEGYHSSNYVGFCGIDAWFIKKGWKGVLQSKSCFIPNFSYLACSWQCWRNVRVWYHVIYLK